MSREEQLIELTVSVSQETIEEIQFLANREGLPVAEMTAKLLRNEAEAQAGLRRGPPLRRYMYR